MVPLFFGKVENFRLILNEPEKFKEYLLRLNGKQIQLALEKYKRPRSAAENRYYWGVVIEILGNHFGSLPNEVHDALRWLFLRKDGQLPTVRSTASLSEPEFLKYLEQIRFWALTEYGIDIPLPNEVDNE